MTTPQRDPALRFAPPPEEHPPLSRALAILANPRGLDDPAKLRAELRGKVVLITGASYGLGAAGAKLFASAGALTLITARTHEKLDAVAADIRAVGGTVHVYPTDLGDPVQARALADRVLAEHGQVDVLVHNAGKSLRRSIALSYDRYRDFERTMAINYHGAVALTLGLLPSMRMRNSGHIVNVSTIGVRVAPAPNWAAYQASKGAFDTWMRSVALEMAADRIGLTTIYMALMYTRMSSPTPIFRYLPGLLPEDAAKLLARAVVDKPTEISPPWLRPLELGSVVLRRPVSWAMSLAAPLFKDTAASRSAIESGHEKQLAPSAVSAMRGASALGHTLAQAALGLRSAGVLTPVGPVELWRVARGLARTGVSPAALVALSAARYPDRVAVVDERCSLTYAELGLRVEAVAAALAARYGLGPGRSVALMCRNHAGLVVALFAAMRLGCDLVLLNTEFPAPQLEQVLARYDFALAIHDEEYCQTFADAGSTAPRILAWQDHPCGENTLDQLAVGGDHPAPRITQPGKLIVLTSGTTTGTFKGADRSSRTLDVLGGLATLLRRVPVRSGAPILIAPPLFHGFGLAIAVLGVGVGAPIVIRRRLDPAATLLDIARRDVKLLFAVPVMLQRLLDAPEASAYDLSSLDAVFTAAAPLSPALALRWMDTYGEKLYNGYGSTEVGFAALADPADLRAAPGCVGRAPLGVVTKIMGADGREKPAGETGHVCVGGPMLIDGYVGGGNKSRLGGLMNTGDLGHYDAGGRLHIDGREDDMIISGGENVYPQEVENILARLPGVREVAVIGVPDAEFGQRLKAVVVPASGTLEASALRAYLKANVARYMMPRDFVFVDDLPRNASGKVLRRKLAELA